MTVPAFRGLLPTLKAFGGFNAAELDAVAAVLKAENLAQDQVLFREGDRASSCYVIASGRVRVTLERGAKPKQLAMLGRGELIGQMALLDGGKRSATCAAVEPTTVLRLDREQFDLLFRSGSSFALKFVDALTRMLVAQLRFATRQLATMSAEPPQSSGRGSRVPDLRAGLERVAQSTLDCTVDGIGVDDVEVVIPDGLRRP